MALTHRQKRRWALVILLVGMPLYVILMVTLLSVMGRPPVWLELLIYAISGVIWVLPFRFVFLGVGQDAPDDED